jgi:hypothetical protein
MNTTEYQKAELSNLQYEEISLPLDLRNAVEAGDTEEIIRLRKRKENLPSEIFGAKAAVLQNEISELKAEQAEAHNRLDRARIHNKETDAKAISALRVLDEEKLRVNNEAYSSLATIYNIQNEIQRRGNQIRDLELKLSKLLDEDE